MLELKAFSRMRSHQPDRVLLVRGHGDGPTGLSKIVQVFEQLPKLSCFRNRLLLPLTNPMEHCVYDPGRAVQYKALHRDPQSSAALRASLGDFPACLLQRDRKSTRLNSSHSQISYAVFCLKKKKKKKYTIVLNERHEES